MSIEGQPNWSLMEEQLLFTVSDNAVVSLELLTRARIDYADQCYARGKVPDREELTRHALRSADRLGWGTTANVASLGRSLHIKRLSEDFVLAENYDPSAPPEAIKERTSLTCIRADSGEFALAKQPLADNPWERARFCPASLRLHMPSSADQQVAKRFNDYCHRNRYPDPLTIHRS